MDESITNKKVTVSKKDYEALGKLMNMKVAKPKNKPRCVTAFDGVGWEAAKSVLFSSKKKPPLAGIHVTSWSKTIS